MHNLKIIQKKNMKNIHPRYISGIVDGDGSFGVHIAKIIGLKGIVWKNKFTFHFNCCFKSTKQINVSNNIGLLSNFRLYRKSSYRQELLLLDI